MHESFDYTLVCRLIWLKLLKMKAILSCRFSGGTINLSSFSVATNKVSMFVVFAIEGCEYNRK